MSILYIFEQKIVKHLLSIVGSDFFFHALDTLVFRTLYAKIDYLDPYAHLHLLITSSTNIPHFS